MIRLVQFTVIAVSIFLDGHIYMLLELIFYRLRCNLKKLLKESSSLLLSFRASQNKLSAK